MIVYPKIKAHGMALKLKLMASPPHRDFRKFLHSHPRISFYPKSLSAHDVCILKRNEFKLDAQADVDLTPQV